MNNILRICICMIFLSTSLLSQNEKFAEKRVRLNAKFGYNILFKETFRENYDQKLFIGSSSIPLSINIGVQYNVSNGLALFLEGGRSNYQLTSSEEISLKIHPLTLGIQYFFPNGFLGSKRINPYIGTGISFHWAIFNVKYFQTDISGNIIEVIEESNTYTGFGVDFDFGVDYQLDNTFVLGVFSKINPSNVGDSEKGGLGNIGGFTVFGKFGLKL